jgi:hypothetical protein
MEGFVQIKADVPRDLKRRAFAALALREERFNHWLKRQLEELLRALLAWLLAWRRGLALAMGHLVLRIWPNFRRA